MTTDLRRLIPLALALLLGAAALTIGATPPPARGQASLESERAAAAQLRAAIAAEGQRIAATRAGLADAERRLAVFAARAQKRQAQLADAQNRLVRARIRLSRLQRREAQAKRTLSENLSASYKAGRPSFVTVVLNADGFADLLGRVELLKRVSRRNATILDDTRAARAAVVKQAAALEKLKTRYSALAKAAIADRNRADVVRAALLRRQEAQLARRSGVAARLAAVRTRIGRLERQQAAAARQAQAAAGATQQAPMPSGGGGGSGAVAKVVAAANQIATTPYVWGGGHGGASGGYDCSGSISYALAAAGLISSPLDSTGFMSWGEPGPGSRITVYANAGHAFMIVDGRRFDTSNLSGGGTRWSSSSRSTAGFVARHPPGL
jgi:cell wall-associated NlpC family hydrolase